MGSQALLTQALVPPPPLAHRYENWRVIGRALGLTVEAPHQIALEQPKGRGVLVHTGAAQPVRVWPLERYQRAVKRLREMNRDVQLVCDPEQRDWWLKAGERGVATPRTIAELLELMDEAGVFIGNDSGPGHLAAFCGIPTFTFFGPQVPEWFVPLHPAAEWIEGKACPYKPCSDYCMFASPHCLNGVSEAEAVPRLERFVRKHLGA
jgi:heptosyltransferase-2